MTKEEKRSNLVGAFQDDAALHSLGFRFLQSCIPGHISPSYSWGHMLNKRQPEQSPVRLGWPYRSKQSRPVRATRIALGSALPICSDAIASRQRLHKSGSPPLDDTGKYRTRTGVGIDEPRIVYENAESGE